MPCRLCRSENQRRIRSEINIHFPRNLERSILVFPELTICLDCGLAEFLLGNADLQSLTDNFYYSESRTLWSVRLTN